VASTALPYIIAAYRNPALLESLDNDFDASTPCTVARRASVAQGRALLGVWERAINVTPWNTDESRKSCEEMLAAFSKTLKVPADPTAMTPANGHFPPIWGTVCMSKGLSLSQTTYIFLFNHAKAMLSAAVRASVMGPYQAQSFLASAWLKAEMHKAIERNWDVPVEDAGQECPVLDLWMGRHELLYSRIFNS
jgi:urease accessory protein